VGAESDESSPGRIIAGWGSAGRTTICVDGREVEAEKNSRPTTVNGDGPEPEKGACEEGGASCESPEPDEPERAIGEGAEDKGAATGRKGMYGRH
jgi:hypothetical protein